MYYNKKSVTINGRITLIKRYYVKTRDLKAGMKIDQNIKDRLDRVLIARGTALDD